MTATDGLFDGPVRALPAKRLRGRVTAPGDKSVSQRALILGALAEGETQITGLLESADVMSTAGALRALGADIVRDGPGVWRVTGTGGRFRTPEAPLDFGNSGTGARLTMGAVAGAGAQAVFTGDASLSQRPMQRVLAPLRAMGAACESADGRLPVTVKGDGPLRAMAHRLPVASAQVKSAILLAGLGADGITAVIEPAPSRDHTERLLPLFGAEMLTATGSDGAGWAAVRGPARLKGARVTVPGDPSSAAFLIAAALIVPGSEVRIENVMRNPQRDGFVDTLIEMGARITMEEADPPLVNRGAPEGGIPAGGEAVVHYTVRQSPRLRGIAVPAAWAPSMIDEYPILAVVAAFARGPSRFEGLAELRVKESDRLAATQALLTANGVKAEVEGDALIVHGAGGKPPAGGGRVQTHHDHRIAMAAPVLGLGAGAPVTVDDASMIATSYPEFFEHMAALGARMEKAE